MQLTLPDTLVEQLKAAAVADGKSLEQWLVEAVKARSDDQQWQDLLTYGRQRGRALGFAEEQSADFVHEWREKRK